MPTLPLLLPLAVVNVRDPAFAGGAKGDVVYDSEQNFVSGTNDRVAFQAAFDFIADKGGGRIYIPRGDYLISGQVTYEHASLSNQYVYVEGDAGGTVIVCENDPAFGGVGESTFAMRQLWPSRWFGITFRAKKSTSNISDDADVGFVITDRSDTGVIAGCNFYGIWARRAVVEGRDLLLERSSFMGCRAWDTVTGVGFGVATFDDWNRAEAFECNWQSFGFWRGKNFSKVGSRAFIQLTDPARGPGLPQPGAYRTRARFVRCNIGTPSDSAISYGIECRPEGPEAVGAVVSVGGRPDSILIEACGFDISGASPTAVAMRLKQAQTVDIVNTSCGFADDPRVILELIDCKRVRAFNLNAIPGTANPDFAPSIDVHTDCETVEFVECEGRDGRPIPINVI